MKATIVQVCETLGEGGLENVIRDLALHSDPDQFKQRVICRTEGGYTAAVLRRAGIPVHVIGKRQFTLQLVKAYLNKIPVSRSFHEQLASFDLKGWGSR